MASYNFADVTVTGEIPYAAFGVGGVLASVLAYAGPLRFRAWLFGLSAILGIVWLANRPRTVVADTGGILDYNANLSP